MTAKRYKIQTALLLPLGLSLLFGFLLLALCLYQKEPVSKLVILSLIILFFAIVFLESSFRCIVIDDSAITHHKLLRQKTLSWAEINSFDALSLKKRVFSTLSSEDSFLIFTNAYANHADLMQEILARLPENSASAETRELASFPPVKRGDIISFWITAIILGGILLYQASTYIR